MSPTTMGAVPTLDVSGLQSFAFGKRSVLWWGIVILMFIEGTLLAILFASYIYVQGDYQTWPPSAPMPILPATLSTLTFVLSCAPMWLCRNAAIAMNLERARAWLVVATVVALVATALRFWQLAAMPFDWTESSYASIVWTSLGTHMTEVIAGVGENLLMIALFFKGPVERKHFEDLEAGAYFWLFAALVWVPFAILFIADGAVR
jgi:cytochrome c oxidase subunit I+III